MKVCFFKKASAVKCAGEERISPRGHQLIYYHAVDSSLKFTSAYHTSRFT